MITSRVTRNGPCPCSSGKKYKHCCLLKDRLLPAETLIRALPAPVRAAVPGVSPRPRPSVSPRLSDACPLQRGKLERAASRCAFA
jgi:hypothetical protein